MHLLKEHSPTRNGWEAVNTVKLGQQVHAGVSTEHAGHDASSYRSLPGMVSIGSGGSEIALVGG